MPIENHIFTGGMDLDTEDRFLLKEDWRDALNIQAGTNGEYSMGAIEKMMGNIQKIYQTTTYSQCIGHCVDTNNKFVYFFIADGGTASNPNPDGTYNRHRIIRYNLVSQQIQLLITNALLNFSTEYLITGAEIIDKDFLYWTDDNNEPSKLYIPYALSGFYAAHATDRSYFDAIPYAPLNIPVAVYGSEANGYNNLKNKLYQFRYKYVYVDNTESAWSPISRVTIPSNTEESIDNVEWNNIINIAIPTVGNKMVKRVDLAVRESNRSNFLKITSFDRDNVTDTSTIINYVWRNDEPLISLDSAEVNRVYDYVPRKAKSLSKLDDSRIAYGNIVENYDYNEDIVAYVSANYTDITPAGGNTQLGGVVVDDNAYYLYYYRHYVFPFLTDDPYNAIYYSLDFNGQTSGYESYTFTYTKTDGNTTVSGGFSVNLSDAGSINQLVELIRLQFTINGIWSVSDNNLANVLVLNQNITQNGYYYDQVIGPGKLIIAQSLDSIPTSERTNFPNWINSLTVTVTSSYTGSIVGTPLPTWKRGTTHKFGLVYYDKAGRASTVYTSDDMTESVRWFSTAPGNSQVFLRMGIEHTPPEWAVKYQVVYGGNNTYLSDPVEGRGFIQFKVGTVGVSDLGTGYRAIELDPIIGYNAKFSNSVINYTWTRSDRVRPLYNQNGGIYFSNSQVESYEIVKAETDNDGIYTIHILNTDANYLIETGDIIEIYSISTQNQNQFWYEIGIIHDIINPGQTNRFHGGDITNQSAFQAAQLSLPGGDVYLKNRLMPSSSAVSSSVSSFVVEESNFSDFQISCDTNIGRFNIVDDSYKEIRRKTTVRYSDVYIPETNINGLGTFYDLNFNTYDYAYGSIQKLVSKNKKLLVFQELKVGQVLVNESLLNDLSGQALVQRSDQVLSEIQYYAGEFGIGTHPESHASYGFSDYFVDTFRGAVLRLSNDGITKISDYKMSNYFYRRFQTSYRATRTHRIYGVYNEKNKEYILAMTAVKRAGDPGDITLLEAETVIFNEAKNRWTSFASFTPTWMAPAGLDYITFNGNGCWLHNQTNYGSFYGVNTDSIISVIFNEAASNNKFWKSLKVESNKVWVAPTITNQQGQLSELIEEHFEKIENAYWAPFYKDKNTPVALPLYEGDELRSPELKVTLKNSDTVYVKLFSVGAKFESSELTNK